jgi:hypothetical protein
MKIERSGHSEISHPYTELYGVTFQKVVVFFVTNMRTNFQFLMVGVCHSALHMQDTRDGIAYVYISVNHHGPPKRTHTALQTSIRPNNREILQTNSKNIRVYPPPDSRTHIIRIFIDFTDNADNFISYLNYISIFIYLNF